jgi:hypothetical protein
MRRFVGIALLTVAAACGSGGSSSSYQPSVALMAGFQPPPAPAPGTGWQVIMPIVEDIEPDGSYEYCTYTDIILTSDAWMKATEGLQTETGHHVVVYYTLNPQPVDTHICTNAEMTDFRYGIAVQGNNKNGTTYLGFPGDLAAQIPAGAQIVVNHHYLNAGGTTVAQAQSATNIYLADPNQPHTPSNLLIAQDDTMTIPPGASTVTVDCTIDQQYTVWAELPHMHNLGQHIRITQTPAASGTPQTLFDMDWDSSLTFDPSIVKQFPLSTPAILQPGDKIHIACDYMNNTGANVTFGTEMCLLAAFTVDPTDVGARMCNRGQWSGF